MAKLPVEPFSRDDIIAIVNDALTVRKIVILPPFPADVDDKTYSLKLVNGVLSWVEEVE